MTIALYMDHHVPSAITGGLRRRGVDVRTTAEDGYAEAEDEDILSRATRLGRLVYTNDTMISWPLRSNGCVCAASSPASPTPTR